MEKLKETDFTSDHVVSFNAHADTGEASTLHLDGIHTAILPEEWQLATIGTDRSSFFRCGGGSWCNEPK